MFKRKCDTTLLELPNNVRPRQSTRAKRASLRLNNMEKCIDLIIPKRVSQSYIQRFVAQHHDWITQTLKTLPEPVHFENGVRFPFFGETLTLNIQKDKGERSKILLITLGHHIFSIFGFIGWLFNSKIILSIYILTLVGMVILWRMNEGRCVITHAVTEISGNKEYKKFNDIYKITGIKKLVRARYLYYGSLAVCISIAAYKLFR